MEDETEALKAEVAELREKVADLEGQVAALKAGTTTINWYPTAGAQPAPGGFYTYNVNTSSNALPLNWNISGGNWMGT